MFRFLAYHYRRKNDIILTLFDGEIMSLDESELFLWKEEKITDWNFYTGHGIEDGWILHLISC